MRSGGFCRRAVALAGVIAIAVATAGTAHPSLPSLVTPIQAARAAQDGAVRINAGGDAYTDGDGHVWAADTWYTGGERATRYARMRVRGTQDPALYQSQRWGAFSYAIPVPAGDYRVTLKFAETYWRHPGSRVFDVRIDDHLVLSHFDIMAGAPARTAIDRSFSAHVTGDTLIIQFTPIRDEAAIAAIAVEPEAPDAQEPLPSAIGTATPSETAAPSATATATQPPTYTATNTATPIASPTATRTATPSATPTSTNTPPPPTVTSTPTSIDQATAPDPGSGENPPVDSPTATATFSPTATGTPTATDSPVPTATPSPTSTATSTRTATASATPSSTATPTLPRSTPRASATATSTSTATSTRVPSAMPAPSSTPAPAPTSLPDTTVGIHLLLSFNNHIPVTNGSRPGEIPADYTWGASMNGMANVPGAAPWHEKYTPWQRENDDNQDSPAWFQTNHPDWIMYAADGTSPAGYGPYYNYQDHSDVTLDYANPAVQRYVAANWIKWLGAGYQGISIDNGITDNNTNAVGHYDLNHTWVQQYSGKEPGDAAFTAASTQALANIVAIVKAKYPRASITVNHAYNCSWDAQADYEAGLNAVSMLLDESELQIWDTNSQCAKAGGSEWLTTMREYQHIQKDLSKGFADDTNADYTVTPYMTDTNLPARADLEWRLANYLLIKYTHTYFRWGAEAQYGQPIAMQREYSAPIGSPTGDFYAAQGVYARDYTGGLALVNPDAVITHTVTLPAGYSDLYGHAAISYALPPRSGLVLVHTPPPGATGTAGATPTGTPGA